MLGEKRKQVHSWSRNEWHGFLMINKETGPTSHDTVDRLRNILGYRKIGHTGTLDPAAYGLLLVCLGRGCKIVQFLTEWDKEYIAKIRLGEETDTYDAQGEILHVNDDLDLSEVEIEQTVSSFLGEQWQLSPSYAALKFKGKRLYQYAREGKSVPQKRRKIKITDIRLEEIDLPIISIRVTCSSGTYVRTIAHDIGKELGCGAHLSLLCRTRVGPLLLRDALTLREVQTEKRRIADIFVSIEDILNYLPSLVIKNGYKNRIKNGVSLKPMHIDSIQKDFKKGERLTVKDESGKILAVGDSVVSSRQILDSENEKSIFRYRRVLF